MAASIKVETAKQNANDIFSIDLLSIINRRKIAIITSGLVGILLGVGYLLFLSPTYQSRCQILLMQNESASMASQIRSGESSISEDLLATHMSLLQSKRIVTNAIDADGLAELEPLVQSVPTNKTLAEHIIGSLYVTHVGTGSSRGARVLQLAFRDKDPEVSQLVVTAILEEYKRFVASKFRDVNREAVDLINKARHDIEADIEAVSTEYREFRGSSPILSSTAGGANIYALRYEELAADVSELLVSMDEAQSRINLVQSGLERLKGSSGPELEKLALIDEKNAERLGILVAVERGEAQTAAFQSQQPERIAGAQAEYNTLLELRTQLRRVRQDFGASHPEVQTLSSQISEMEDFFNSRQKILSGSSNQKQLTPDDVMQAYINLLKNDLLGLEQRQQDLKKQMAMAEIEAKKLVDYELQNEEYIREMTRQSDLYNSIVERLRDINMQQDSSALIQEVIEDPEIGEKVSPNIQIASALTIFSTMLMTVMSVLMLELSDRRIRSAEDLEQIYESGVISHIPDFDRDPELKSIMKKIADGSPKVSPAVFTLHDTKSSISEAYRNIRTQVLFTLGGEHKIFAITSPSQGDGKSTTTVNLAVSFAKMNKPILLIDSDMRRPNVHAIFGLENKKGLAEVVNGTLSIDEACQQGPLPNLKILTSGKIPDNPAELLASEEFKTMLEAARMEFAYVIVDCPPLLAVSDPAIIAPLVDRVILVTSLDSQSLTKSRQCNRILSSVNAKLAGLIVNRAGRTNSGYTYTNYSNNYTTNYTT